MDTSRLDQASNRRTLAGLAADDVGISDSRPPLVLLHGLSFDRSMWRPALAELRRCDPGRRALAFDLPGHGASADWSSYDIEAVTDGVHRAVEEAQLSAPVVVGDSLSAVIATIYAARYPTHGVVNVDQPLQAAPFAGLVKSLADTLRGPAFPAVWDMFAASMHMELLPGAAQDLVRSTCTPRQDVVLGYWREVIQRPVDETTELATTGLAGLRTRGVPYLVIAGSDPDPAYQRWLQEMLPQASVVVWPGSGHFPHLAHPDRFADCLATTAAQSAPFHAGAV